MLNDNQLYEENILFYTIMKRLVQLKLTPKQLEEVQIILLRNINLSFKKLPEVLINSVSFKNLKKSSEFSEFINLIFLNQINNKNLIEILDFSIQLILLKPMLWEEIKIFNREKYKSNILEIKDSLSLEYDLSSSLEPYSLRVVTSLIIYILLTLDCNIDELILKKSSDIIQNLRLRLIKLIATTKINASAIFSLIFNESANQSIKSTAGTNFESRVHEKIAPLCENILNQRHDKKIPSVEYDFIAVYKNKKIGISAKRTLRERYKQNLEHATDLEVDAMLLITLGTDLNQTTINNIIQKDFYFILVSQEIYNKYKYLKENAKVFSSENFNFDLINFK